MAILIPIFLAAFATILVVVGLATSYFKSKQRNQIRSMLRNVDSSSSARRSGDLLLDDQVDNGFEDLLKRFSFIEKLDVFIEQSGEKTTSLPAGLTGPVAALLGSTLPILNLLRKRAKNLAEFEKQLPEALDFLSRSMRAGHGFSIAMELLANDSPDPLGSAFRRVANDMQLGSALDVALGRLSAQVPLLDVRFFVSSVSLQQETGGNLSEVLAKLALIIRERFRLKGQVQAVSAHGRITGMVLVLMPVVVALIMMFTSPQYLADLAADKIGRIMIYGAVGGQILAFFVIRKIINIKV
jgi:tight adherence protein B